VAVLTYGACYAAFYGGSAPVEVPFFTRLARSWDLPGELRVLDMGCGTGRLLGPLAALGWHVVGMDPQPENLVLARRVAERTPGVGEVVAGGFGDLEAVEDFDMVVAAADPWWYLLTATARSEALVRLRRALRPQGVVVLEGPNFEWILDHYCEPQPTQADVNGVRVRRVPRHDIDRAAGTWTHIDTFSTPESDEVLTMIHRFAIISPDEVRFALEHAGFEPVDLYTNWASTTPGGPEGPRIVAVGRRPG
jgi:SAM-dependent methyltransferase